MYIYKDFSACHVCYKISEVPFSTKILTTERGYNRPDLTASNLTTISTATATQWNVFQEHITARAEHVISQSEKTCSRELTIRLGQDKNAISSSFLHLKVTMDIPKALRAVVAQSLFRSTKQDHVQWKLRNNLIFDKGVTFYSYIHTTDTTATSTHWSKLRVTLPWKVPAGAFLSTQIPDKVLLVVNVSRQMKLILDWLPDDWDDFRGSGGEGREGGCKGRVREILFWYMHSLFFLISVTTLNLSC